MEFTRKEFKYMQLAHRDGVDCICYIQNRVIRVNDRREELEKLYKGLIF